MPCEGRLLPAHTQSKRAIVENLEARQSDKPGEPLFFVVTSEEYQPLLGSRPRECNWGMKRPPGSRKDVTSNFFWKRASQPVLGSSDHYKASLNAGRPSHELFASWWAYLASEEIAAVYEK